MPYLCLLPTCLMYSCLCWSSSQENLGYHLAYCVRSSLNTQIQSLPDSFPGRYPSPSVILALDYTTGALERARITPNLTKMSGDTLIAFRASEILTMTLYSRSELSRLEPIIHLKINSAGLFINTTVGLKNY